MTAALKLQSSRWIHIPNRWSSGYPKMEPIRFTLPQIGPNVPFHKINELTAARGLVVGSLAGAAAWLTVGALMVVL